MSPHGAYRDPVFVDASEKKRAAEFRAVVPAFVILKKSRERLTRPVGRFGRRRARV